MLNVIFATHTEILDMMGARDKMDATVMAELDANCNVEAETKHFLNLLSFIEELDAYQEETIYVNIASSELCTKYFPESDDKVKAAYLTIAGNHVMMLNDRFDLGTMAHELQHFMDAVDGRLAFYPQEQMIEWDGVKHQAVDLQQGKQKLEEYAVLPWERTAHALEAKYTTDQDYADKINAILA